MPKQWLYDQKLKILKGPCYKRSGGTLQTVSEEAIIAYANAVREVKDITNDDDLYRTLRSSFGQDSVAHSLLQVTAKTHKPEFKFRAIHAQPRSIFFPAMAWVRETLKTIIRKTPCIMRDSAQMLQKLAHRKFARNVVFVKADIADYFMSGHHREILECCAEAIVDPIDQRVFRTLAGFILDHQIISVRESDAAWRVTIGSGMGLTCSGEISDVAYHELVERGQLDYITPEITNRTGIQWYGRFKDDLLIIFDDDRLKKVNTLRQIIGRGRFFKLKVEAMSSISCTMLDVHLWKGPRFEATGRLDFRVFQKDTQIWEPLSPTSAHPQHVHMNWPKGMCKRFHRLCSQSSVAREVSRRFVARLDLFTPERPRPDNRRPKPFSRLILPFHTMWTGLGAHSIIHDAAEEAGISHNIVANVAIGWKLSAKHVGQNIMSGNGFLHQDCYGDPTRHSIWRLEG